MASNKKVKRFNVKFDRADYQLFLSRVYSAGEGMLKPLITSSEKSGELFVYDAAGLTEEDLEVFQDFIEEPTALHCEYPDSADSLDALVEHGLLTLHPSDEDDVGEYRLN